jgi:hypothetical protein
LERNSHREQSLTLVGCCAAANHYRFFAGNPQGHC